MMAVVHLRIVACAGAPVRRCGGAEVFEWEVPGPRVGRHAACKYEVLGSGSGIRGSGCAGARVPGARYQVSGAKVRGSSVEWGRFT